MPRRLPGLLLLILLLLGLFYARPVWADSYSSDHANVIVVLSPLWLMTSGDVTVKADDEICNYVPSIDASRMCPDLEPGQYEISVTSEKYFATPSSYDVDLSSGSNHSFYFKLYQNNHQLYMPNVQGPQ